MAILRLEPAGKDYIWGGTRLREEYGKDLPLTPLAETWELSCHPDGPCRIAREGNGPDRGLTLPEYLAKHGRTVLGHNCERFSDFPILVKLIDARERLSVQVHPDDGYARRVEDSFGKTEMWYVVEAEPGAVLYHGFRREITKEEFRRRIGDGSLDEVLRAVPVVSGDVIFIEAGTIHAIGPGIVIAEIQQNSNLTYRVFDYGRKGPDGKPRELHVEKALDVTGLHPPKSHAIQGDRLAECPSFVVDRLMVSDPVQRVVGDDSFAHLLVVEGAGEIAGDGEIAPLRKGGSVLVTAGTGRITLSGEFTALWTEIPPERA